MSRNLTSQLNEQLKQYNKYEDTLDVFVNLLIKRSPTVFVLINMTLMIWLVQTIYSSRLDSIPRSIYFFAPFFSQNPIINLYATQDNQCRVNFDKITLKTFPIIKNEFFNKKNLTKWGKQSVIFCSEKNQQPANFSRECDPSLIYCSGYCVSQIQNCPITNIKKIALNQKMPAGYQKFFSNQHYIFLYTRESKNDYIVGLSAQFQYQCANGFKLYDKYQTFQEYWNSTTQCGQQGSLPSQIFHIFTQMPVKNFFLDNQLWSNSIQQLSPSIEVTLGSISLIRFDNKTLECNKAQYLSKNLKNMITDQPMKPTFTQSMLIIAFVFFTLSWAWLVGYYCFEGSKKQKNMIMILMIIIQLIVITFLYSQNAYMFESQKVINQIARCVQTQLQATSHWSFGITDSSPFRSIMYCCTCFLLLQIVAQFIDRQIYVPYYSINNENQQNRCKCC